MRLVFANPRPSALVFLALTEGCVVHSTAPRSGGPKGVEAAALTNGDTVRGALRAPSARERALAVELRRDVQELSGKIGERNAEQKWELASASDFIALELEQAGYHVERQGYEAGDIVAQNLEVTIPGRARGSEIVLVGAHYDSAPGSPGADDNASGAAAVLALARGFSGSHPSLTLRFVQFSNSERPFSQTADMGSVIYAKRAKVNGDRITAMISVESIGYFSDTPKSQSYPKNLAADYPATGNFVGIVGNEQSRPLVERVYRSFSRFASIPVRSAVLPVETPDAGWSDNWAFWQFGFPALMVTDTAPFRYPHYHKSTDTPDKLDFERMARVVAALEKAIVELADVRGGTLDQG